jgi:hypothetical protein
VDRLTIWATQDDADASRVAAPIRSILDEYLPPGNGVAILGRTSRALYRSLRVVFRSAARQRVPPGICGSVGGRNAECSASSVFLGRSAPPSPLERWRRNGSRAGSHGERLWARRGMPDDVGPSRAGQPDQRVREAPGREAATDLFCCRFVRPAARDRRLARAEPVARASPGMRSQQGSGKMPGHWHTPTGLFTLL